MQEWKSSPADWSELACLLQIGNTSQCEVVPDNLLSATARPTTLHYETLYIPSHPVCLHSNPQPAVEQSLVRAEAAQAPAAMRVLHSAQLCLPDCTVALRMHPQSHPAVAVQPEMNWVCGLPCNNTGTQRHGPSIRDKTGILHAVP